MDIDKYNTAIQGFFNKAREQGYSYMIIMEDMFNYEDYPYYSNSYDECINYIKEHSGFNMQRFLSLFDVLNGKMIKGI